MIGDITTYSYTGAVQTAILKRGTRYKIECFGAEGTDTSEWYGGLGGYVSGEVEFAVNTEANIYAGGIPNGITGGWNGGGNGDAGWYNPGTGGGGASDIRVGGTALANRIIVAGGGGGYGRYPDNIYESLVACGGGLVGGDGDFQDPATIAGMGYGGTQTEGGAGSTYPGTLGIGGNGTHNGSGGGGGGGGGGYYGGGGSNCYCRAGGGSSYYGTLENPETTPGVNEGDGYIVITVLAETNNFRFAQII